MKREEAIQKIVNSYPEETLFIAATGKICRELFEYRVNNNQKPNDFYMIGSMGCAPAIGLGIALSTKKKVVVLNGDGACLMKLGTIATIEKYKPKNLEIIILNNDSYDSTGGQETTFKYIKKFVKKYCKIVDVEKGARKDLGRPTISPKKIRDNFHEKVLS